MRSEPCEISTKPVVLMMHIISHVRLMSAVLTTFPWATDFIVKDIQTIFNDRLYSVRLCNDHM